MIPKNYFCLEKFKRIASNLKTKFLSFQDASLSASNFINLTPNLSIKFNPQQLKTKLRVKFVQVVRVVGVAVSSVKFARYLHGYFIVVFVAKRANCDKKSQVV